MKKHLLALFILMILSSFAFAQDDVNFHPYEYPKIEPTLELKAGYDFLSYDGSKRAREYEYLHNSIVLGAKLIAFPFPHRVHLEIDILNEKDYFGDLSYAYKDLVLFRWINRTTFHNLENITLLDLGTDANYTVDVRDKGKEYGIKTGLNKAFLRFKTPDFPLHLFIEGQLTDKEGSSQQRFLGGSGFYNNMKRTSTKRDIDRHSSDITVGINSHLGPVEAEYSHSEMRFKEEGDKVLSDYYLAGGGRAAGIYPHNLIPEIEGSSDTIKLHTSYTGRLVASLTTTWSDRSNNDSNTKAEYFTGQGEVSLIPLHNLSLFVRYRHREIDIDNPDTLPVGYLGFSSYTTQTTQIRDSITSKSDSVSTTLRYRISKGITLRARYSYDRQDRENSLQWSMDEVTTKNSVSVSADTRPLKSLNLGLRYEHQEIENPAYNTQPNRSDTTAMSFTWRPVDIAIVSLTLSHSDEERRDIVYSTMQPTTDAKNRDSKKDKASGLVTLMVSENTSLTLGYAYYKNTIQQDLIYNDFSNIDELDKSTQYRDKAQNYSLTLSTRPSKRIDISGGISHTIASVKFTPNNSDALSPVSIGSFSEVKSQQTDYDISGGYDFKDGWRAALRYRYTRFDNMIENPENPEVSDGDAQSVIITLTRRWN